MRIALIAINPIQAMEAPTRGNYVILKPVKDALVGVLDLESQKFVTGSSKSSAMDIYDREILTQRVSGEVGIFDLSTHQPKGQMELPLSAFGALRAWAVSPDLRWLAVSGATRGAVGDLTAGKRLYSTRGFHGAHFDGDQAFLRRFPAKLQSFSGVRNPRPQSFRSSLVHLSLYEAGSRRNRQRTAERGARLVAPRAPGREIS